MAKVTPWSVKGIDDDTRSIAREAALASGLTIGKWIDHAIMQSTRPTARMRRAVAESWRRTVFNRPGATVGLGFGATGMTALFLVVIALRFGDLPVPVGKASNANAAQSTVSAPAETAPPKPLPPAPVAKKQPKPEPPAPVAKKQPKPEPPAPVAKKQPKPEPPQQFAAISPPPPAIEPRVPAPGPLPGPSAAGQPSRPLGQAGIAEIQRLLMVLNFTPGQSDGIAGANTVAAIRLYQQFAGLPVDGTATEALLRDLREVTRTVKADAGATAAR
jgi:hypothetical protein